MRLCEIHTQKAGPLGSQVFNFRDSWNSSVRQNVLFSGPNGCGKSTVLRIPALLWNAFGHWLHARKPLPNRNRDREWLQRWEGVAVILEDLPYQAPPLVLVCGTPEFSDELQRKYPNHVFIGEEDRSFIWSPSPWFDRFTDARKRMLSTWEKEALPNVIFLDAEERRWVSPKRGLGEMKPDNLEQRWLSRYLVSEKWEGQLEASLLSLKAADPERFFALLKNMNAFLTDKAILPEVQLGQNRLRVRISNGGEVTHFLDDLSAGEHQVLIQLYIISRWLEPGGIVLIDEPDLFLHPSLISGFLAQLEKMVVDRHGQLIIPSHVPEVWDRYEAIGLRILLRAQK